MQSNQAAFIKLMKHPVKNRMFLFTRLPAAFFAGVRLRDVSEHSCQVSVPYKWLSQNPFRSTYFACLSMAAEMSTGALAMSNVYRSSPPVSMLVVKVESEYFKKATTRTYFVCDDGALFTRAVEEAIATGEPRTVRAKSVGRNKEGDLIAEFYFTWSFRAKRETTDKS